MAGIHLHQHDLVDEGAEAIRPWLARIEGLTHVFVQGNDIFERNPSPSGVLPRNPRRSVVVGEGHWYLDVDPSRLSPELHQVRGDGSDPLALVATSDIARDYEVVPWLNLLNGAWSGDVTGNCVVDLRGRSIPRWLCPNAPGVAAMWRAVFGALLDRYPYRRYLIDRIRFPDWGGERVQPRNLLSCFCRHCDAGMREQGIDVTAVRSALTVVDQRIGEGSYAAGVTAFAESADIQQWITFRQNSISRFVDNLTQHVRSLDPTAELWLDLWPPAYAWLLGQDYATLTASSARLKHFPYHRLGGGADVLSLIDNLAHDEAEHEAAFAAFVRLFEIDYGLTFAQFRAGGFPIALVADQNRRVRELATPDTFVWSGVQMWNLPPGEVLAAIRAADASADDVIYYCYGWAADELFGAGSQTRPAGGIAERPRATMGVTHA